MSESQTSEEGEHPQPYIIFVVVFLFFLTGLLGFLVCHLLKKKGYRCRTGDMDYGEEEEEAEKLGGNTDDSEENQDTVEQILKCIIENEANMEAFNEMFGNHKVCVRHDPRLRKESIAGIPSHHHTVHSGTDINSCHLCAQARSKKGRRHSRTPRFKQRPGEQTVFSVGRFRVTHHDKKLHGGPNHLVSSGDLLDQSQDSEDQKEGGYNLRSMFKDIKPTSETSNRVAPSVGKRRKSVTFFGLRRGSDPAGMKVADGPDRETGGVKLAIQKQPVVLEEQSQPGNIEIAPERGTKSETESPKTPTPAVGSVKSPSKNEIQTNDTIPAAEDRSNEGLSLDSSMNPVIKPSIEGTAASVPSSLPISTPASSKQAFTTSEKQGHVEDKVLKDKEAYDPGPLQTSTPIAPMHGTIPDFAPVIPTNQPERHSSTDVPVTQTPPDPSPDLEQCLRGNLALISLGSSPPSSSQIKTASTLSLRSPTSSLSITPSPKLSSRNAPFGASKTALMPSPSFPSNQAKASGLLSLKGQDREGVRFPKAEETTEVKRGGILKTAKGSAFEGDNKASLLSSPTDQLCKDRLDNLSLSPSSPIGSRASNVTIVRASPDSKREFSVVTMVEKEKESSSSPKAPKKDTYELEIDSEKLQHSPTVSEVGQAESQYGETSRTQGEATVSQEKDDMVEMEDIRDCKVMGDGKAVDE